MKKLALITFLLVGAISMIIMSFHYFELDDTGILRRKEVAHESWYLMIFRTHVLLGLLAMTIGPFQFVERIRKNYPAVHKAIGYLYVISVMLSGISGFVIAPYAMGGWITAIGFSVLSGVWLFTTSRAILAIKNGRIQNHQKWMFLSYSLTFASITQRTLLLVPLFIDIEFMPIYQLSAWLPWLLNLNIGYWLFRRALG